MFVGHRLALEEHGIGERQRCGPARKDPIDMSPNTPAGGRETKLRTGRCTRVQLESRQAKPADGQILKHMTHFEYAQDST